MADMKFWAKPALVQRLINLHGSPNGYQKWAAEAVAVTPDGKPLAKTWLRLMLRRYNPTPPWLVLVLTRIAEDDPMMPRDVAFGLASTWFDIADDSARTLTKKEREAATHE